MNQMANQKGIALLFVLVAVTIMGLMAGLAGSSWKTITQRAKEEELLWRGNQYRKAIGSYYTAGATGTPKVLPRTLEQLIRDPRMLGTVRHLRQLYPDPMTGKDWELIKDGSGLIQGVRSSSQLEPFKKDNFSEENEDFAEKTSYAEWRFVFSPEETQKTRVPARKPRLPFSGSSAGEAGRGMQ
jgi:type II secretory pathway pseudopilin PulG